MDEQSAELADDVPDILAAALLGLKEKERNLFALLYSTGAALKVVAEMIGTFRIHANVNHKKTPESLRVLFAAG